MVRRKYANQIIFLCSICLFCVVLHCIARGDFFSFLHGIQNRSVLDYFNPGQVKNISCKRLGFAKIRLPVTALVSYPGSGNTWFRHLLQKASGIYTGSVYNSRTLIKAGFRGEGRRDGTVIAIKTHVPFGTKSNKTLATFDRVILLVRDPRKAGEAEFNRRNSNKISLAKDDVLRKELPQFLLKEISVWFLTYTSWVQVKQPLFMVHYEELKLHPKNVMAQVFMFLNISVSDDDLECMTQNAEGQFHRRKHTTADVKLSDDYIHQTEEAKALVNEMYFHRQKKGDDH